MRIQPSTSTSDSSTLPLSSPGDERSRWDGRRGLPLELVVLALLLVVSDGLLTLSGQHPEYWLSTHNGIANLPLVEGLVSQGPVLFMVVAAVYLLVAGLLLAKLPGSWAFVMILPLIYVHLFSVTEWLQCGVPGVMEMNFSRSCSNTGYVIFLITAVPISALIVYVVTMASKGERPSTAWLWLRRFLGATMVVWLLLLVYGVVQAATISQEGWRPVAAGEDRPSPRLASAAAYDLTRSQAILFGGSTGVNSDGAWIANGETWLWDGQVWTEKRLNSTPSARYDHAMAYDERRGVVVLFGGNSEHGGLSDTWEWDGEQWTRHYPSSAPPVRWRHQLIYDNQLQSVVLYGGYYERNGDQQFYDDTWAWNGNSWHRLHFDTAAPYATIFKMVYDQSQGRAVAYLNCDPVGTWFWEDRQWYKPTLITEPPVRSQHHMVYDPRRQHTILFGGHCTRQGGALLNDTWVLENDRWRELTFSRTPAPRWGHLMFYDWQRQSVMLFGGLDSRQYVNDMWELYLPPD
jgi:hypothetical protein